MHPPEIGQHSGPYESPTLGSLANEVEPAAASAGWTANEYGRMCAPGLPISAVMLLGFEGLSVGLAVWQILNWDALLDYVLRNRTPYPLDSLLGPLGFGLTSGSAAALMAALVALGGGDRVVAAVEALSLRFSPLVLAALLPSLFHYLLWNGRDLQFLMVTGTFVLGLKYTLKIALSVPPLSLENGSRWQRIRSSWARWVADLRQCARVIPKSWPLLLAVLGAAGYATYFSYHTVVHHRNVLSSSLDLGMEDNLVYNALRGASLFKSSPLGGPTAIHLGNHATWFTFLIVPFYALYPNAETLLMVQAVLLGGAAIPLYLVGTRYVSRWMACLVAFMYLLYAPLHGANLYDFHYLPLGMFFLWFTVYFAESRHWILTGLFALVSLSVREDVAFGLAILGAYLLLSGRRPKAGLALAALGAVYFLLMKGVVMRRALGGQDAFVHQYVDLIPPGGNRGFAGVVQTIIGNPAFTLETLLMREKLVYLVQIMLPLAFFPLRRPLGLLCGVQGFFFTLLSTKYPPQIQISFQYTAYWITHLFIAIFANLAWLNRAAIALGRAGAAWKWSWVAAMLAASLITSHQLGAVLQRNTAKGGFGPYHFGTKAEDVKRRADLQVLLAMVPPDAKIVAAENVVPQVSNRPDAYTLRTGLYDAEYLLFSVPVWSLEREYVLQALQPGAFGIIKESGNFILAKRGHPSDRNVAMLARLGSRADEG
jgi:uncharacterized membrane protein